MGGCGAHEVVIESPDHSCILGQQPTKHIELVLKAVQQRYLDLMRDHRFRSIVIFKNHGEGAGDQPSAFSLKKQSFPNSWWLMADR